MSDAPSRSLTTATPSPARRAVRASKPAGARRILSIGGGKGGIGKSLVAVNLAIELAGRGQRVVLVDADLGGANLHTCLGIDLPRRTLSDFVERRVERIEDVLTATGIPNLALVSGAMDHLEAANPRHAQKMRLLRHIRAMDVDHAILDLGAGTHPNVLDFFLVSDHGLLVVVPEPTSVENAYRFLKAAFWRRVRNVVTVYGFEPALRAAMAGAMFKTPVEIVAALSAANPEAGQLLTRELERFRPCLVVNQARTARDAQVGAAVVGAWRRFFGLEMDYLGHIQYDDDMWRSVRARRPFLVEHPEALSARCFAHIVDGLAALDAAQARSEGST